jgi:hypothetical protein
MQTQKKADYTALSRRVLAVAIEGEVHDWAAYIDAVAGEDFSKEWMEVARHGSKLPKEVAEIYFPEFKSLRWRD